MSKKKNKFTKQLKAQSLQEISQNNNSVSQMNKSASKPAVVQDSFREKTTIIASSNEIANLDQIKYDLRKTGIVVFSLAIVIAGLIYFDSKYGILLQFGNQLFKTFNIN